MHNYLNYFYINTKIIISFAGQMEFIEY